jgi:hypothetical protein
MDISERRKKKEEAIKERFAIDNLLFFECKSLAAFLNFFFSSKTKVISIFNNSSKRVYVCEVLIQDKLCFILFTD